MISVVCQDALAAVIINDVGVLRDRANAFKPMSTDRWLHELDAATACAAIASQHAMDGKAS